MKTFQFSNEEKNQILSYLMNHRMKNVNEYDTTRWERISKQRKRIKKEIKTLIGWNKNVNIQIPNWLNFDELTNGRLGIKNREIIHNPIEEKYINEEITNILRKLIKLKPKHLW